MITGRGPVTFLVGHGTTPVSPGEKTKNRDDPVRLFSDG